MNRIYKVIWSKVKHQYVVVSELAHSCTKGVAISAGRHTAAVLTVLALTAGVGSQALADNSTAIGSNRVIDATSEGGATLGNNTAIGSNSDGAIAIGGDPDTNDEETTAATVGNNATNAIAMGTNATVNDNGQNSIAIGNGATISKNSTASIAMGLNAQVDTGTGGNNAIAIGSSAHAGGVGGIAIGKEAGTIGAKTGAVAIGINAQAASNSIVMGQNAIADAAQTVAIGYGAKSHSGYGAAIGAFAEVGSNSYGLALGGYSRVGNSAKKSIAIGTSGRGYTEGRTEVKDGASYSIAMGGKTTVGENAEQSVAIGGYQAIVGDNAKYSTAIGTYSDIATNVEHGTAVGYNTNVDANYGTALGNGASANGEWSTALGTSTDANRQATAVGSNAQALASNSVAVGVNSSVAEGADYSVALGTSSKVEEGDAFTTTDLEDFKKKLGDTYNAAWNITSADGTLGVVSVGAKGKERRLVNVARGRIDENSTDAVNGSQLYGLASDLNQKIEKAGGDWTLTTNGGLSDTEKTTVGKGDVVDFSGAKDENGHQNIQISQEQTKDDDGNVTGTKVAVDLNDRVELGAGDQQIVMDATNGNSILTIGNNVSMSANGAANFGKIQFNRESEGQADPQHGSTITGLSNTEWDAANAGKTVAEGGYSDSTRAATEAQLYDAIGSATSSMGWNVTTNGATDNKKVATIKNGAFVDFSGKVDENSANIIVDQNPITDKDGNVVGTNLSFDLNDKIALGTPDVQNNTGIFLDGTTGSATFGGIKVNGESGERTITGLTNTEWDPNTTYNSGRAATEEQLQKAVNQVNADAYNGWKVSANGENDVLVERGDVVDFSSATKTVTRGQETEEHKNITISQDNTDLTFTLNDDLYLGNVNEGTGAYVNVLGSTGQILLGKDATNFINIDGGSRTISGLSNLTWDPMNQKQYDGSSLAATESQLHDAFGYLNDKIDNIDVNISGDDNVNVGKNEGAGSGTGTGESTGSGSADAPKFDFDISMSDTPQFGGHTDDDKGHAANGSVTIVGTGADGTSHKVVIDGATGLASGLSNTDWDWNKYEEGGYQTSNAATESQLHGAMEGTVQYDRDENGNVDKTNVTLNKGGDSVTIHNVAAGTADTDAVNVSQLNQAWDQINNNTTAITNIGNKVGELDSRIDEVGAGAAALAALHPLDFDPDDKWDFSAGYGNYRGENAVAIGAFYRPNEDTMFSVGGTVGNGDNMVNAGVSFKIGQGNNVSTSRVAMAKEIKSMRDIVAKQDAQIQKLTAMVNALVGMEAIAPDTTTMFPDVPENHWAYEAVETMAKTGLVQGYPDGEFKGDRNMTRYEFAQIVYNAIQAGIKVDERLVQEFRPELEYFRIDTISKDKDGNPVIQRVRANEIPATK